MENTIPSVTEPSDLAKRIAATIDREAVNCVRVNGVCPVEGMIADIVAEHIAPLERDAERYRQGRSTFAHKLMVRADGQSMWRYCEPDPLIGFTFDEAWDAAVASARIR